MIDAITQFVHPSSQQQLFLPLVEKLGYEYSDQDSSDTTLLRTLAINRAAAAREEK